jgi:serine/threonine protein kinase
MVSRLPPARETEKRESEPASPESSAVSGKSEIPEKIGVFQVERLLGKGAMGTVYKCLDVALNRHVAIKVLLLEGKEHKERFFREARALAKLSHPNITQIYSAGEHEGYHYFVMEFVDGPSVKEQLEKEKRFSIAKALDIAIQVGKGLKEALQSSVIHRDIKTANIMINSDGLVKITDFGLAKLLTDDHQLTQTRMIMGTPLFISPEQARGEKVDFRTDIYSLGVMLYQMIIGRLPFVAEDSMGLIMMHIKEPVKFPVPSAEFSIPPAIAGIIRKMMAKNPDDRFLTYDQLINNLSQLKKSFQTLQAGESQMAIPEQVQATTTNLSGTGLDVSIMKSTVKVPDKPIRQSFKFPTKLLMPIAVLILLCFFGVLFKQGLKSGPDSLNSGPSASKNAVALDDDQNAQDSPAPMDEGDESPEIEILKNEIEPLSDTRYRVYGTIRNIGTSAVKQLDVEVAFKDSFGEMIEEHHIQAEPPTILPGETGKFSLVFNDIESWDKYYLVVGDIEVETEND